MNILIEELNTFIEYRKEEGKLFWKKCKARRNKVGKEVGCAHDYKGYRGMSFGGKSYLIHRLIWLLEKGEWPKNQIDHINGIRRTIKLRT